MADGGIYVAPTRYNGESDTWEPRCPFGDICSGCDATGFCSRGRAALEALAVLKAEFPERADG